VNGIEDTIAKVMLIILLIIVGICYFCLLGYLAYRPISNPNDPLKFSLLMETSDADTSDVENSDTELSQGELEEMN